MSIKAEENLKLAVYYACHKLQVSRPVTAASIPSEAVCPLKDLKIAEEDHMNPTDKPEIKDNNWPRTIDDIKEYLQNHLGQTKIPL
jgi:hypothetical protein